MGKELADIKADVHSKIRVEPVGDHDDITQLRGSFPGPPGTPYEGGTFCILISIPTDYPFRPPGMKFETKVWHPNISSQTVSFDQRSHSACNSHCEYRVLSAWTLCPVPGLPF